MGKHMIQQKGIIRTGVSWFSSHIKRFFRREDEEQGKRNHLEDLYDRYEKDTKMRSAKKSARTTIQPRQKADVLESVLKRLRNEPNLSQKYLTRRKKIREYMESREPFDKHNELTCPICIEYFINPVPTACGHTFCCRCLDNALLFKGGCPVCRCYLRGQELSPCLAVNNIVRMHVRKSCRPEEIQLYEARLRDTDQFEIKRRLQANSLVVGERLDVRDTEYIWCRGFILNVYRKGDTVTELLIHYQGWNKIYDEILEINSPRLAPLGFYTNREDIPRYALNDNYQTYYSYVRSVAIQVVSGPHQPPPNENPAEQPEAEQAENNEDQRSEENAAENSASEQGQSEIELEVNLSNRLDQASGIVRNFNVAVNSMQERLMLRNILNEMGLGNIGNMINFNELGSGDAVEGGVESEQEGEAIAEQAREESQISESQSIPVQMVDQPVQFPEQINSNSINPLVEVQEPISIPMNQSNPPENPQLLQSQPSALSELDEGNKQ